MIVLFSIQRVMLPLTVLRRFDCVLASTKEKVLSEHRRWRDRLEDEALDSRLNRAAGQRFHNHSPLVQGCINGFSEKEMRKAPPAREVGRTALV